MNKTNTIIGIISRYLLFICYTYLFFGIIAMVGFGYKAYRHFAKTEELTNAMPHSTLKPN
jgi:hypothetical protein